MRDLDTFIIEIVFFFFKNLELSINFRHVNDLQFLNKCFSNQNIREMYFLARQLEKRIFTNSRDFDSHNFFIRNIEFRFSNYNFSFIKSAWYLNDFLMVGTNDAIFGSYFKKSVWKFKTLRRFMIIKQFEIFGNSLIDTTKSKINAFRNLMRYNFCRVKIPLHLLVLHFKLSYNF